MSFFCRWEWQVTPAPLGSLSVKLEGNRWEQRGWILSYQTSRAWPTVCLPSLLTSRVLQSPVCPIWWVVPYCFPPWLCLYCTSWILGCNGFCSITGRRHLNTTCPYGSSLLLCGAHGKFVCFFYSKLTSKANTVLLWDCITSFHFVWCVCFQTGWKVFLCKYCL